MTKRKQPIEVRYEELEQNDGVGWIEEELIEGKNEGKYAVYIGLYLIRFSNLEHALEEGLATLINDRSHDLGFIIIKDLEMFEKIELFYNLAFLQVQVIDKRKNQKLKHLTAIRKQLEDLSILRNRIAHAKWNTLDNDGYVRVDTKTSKENGFIKFKKLKITPIIMKQGVREIDVLTGKLSAFTENIWL